MATESTPLFSVIIPTKDRADYLYHTLRTCSLQDYENLEIIVSDDGSQDHTRDVVQEAARKDPRIRYVTPGAAVGMRDNFEFALDQVKPGYVMALGGDDGLLPYGIRGMRDILQETGQEMLAWPAPVFSYAKARTEKGQLVIHRFSGRRIVRSSDFLENQVKHLHYVDDPESPMFYVKGVTSTRLVDKVRSRTADGRFYSCPTPDGYSGIVLAGEVENYAFSGEPFSIFGTSPSSQGMAYLSSDKQAKQRSEAFFRDVSHRPMHEELASQPYSPLITIMTVDYLLTARDLPGWPGRFPNIDFRKLLVNSLDELSHGLYAEDRLARELTILNEIAEFHGFGEYFRHLVNGSRRYMKKEPFEGNGLSPSRIFLDCSMYGIENILDAAYLVYHFKQIVPRITAPNIWKLITNSLSHRMLAFRKGDRFPGESSWRGVELDCCPDREDQNTGPKQRGKDSLDSRDQAGML